MMSVCCLRFGFVALSSAFGGTREEWHIAPTENIERAAWHGWCETGGGGAVGKT